MESKVVADLRQIQKQFTTLSNGLDAHPGFMTKAGHITKEERDALAQLCVDLHWAIEALGKQGH